MITFDGNRTSETTFSLDTIFLDDTDNIIWTESYYYIGLTWKEDDDSDLASYALRIQKDKYLPRVDWTRRLNHHEDKQEFYWDSFILPITSDNTTLLAIGQAGGEEDDAAGTYPLFAHVTWFNKTDGHIDSQIYFKDKISNISAVFVDESVDDLYFCG